MTSSLVGSEMCIRDRYSKGHGGVPGVLVATQQLQKCWKQHPAEQTYCYPVSYTHLTLPTICSV
eukprot:5777381-Prorocentrum_lima.AAC.1